MVKQFSAEEKRGTCFLPLKVVIFWLNASPRKKLQRNKTCLFCKKEILFMGKRNKKKLAISLQRHY